MEQKRPHQIIITSSDEDTKQKFPAYLWISLAAGAIAGVGTIFGIFWGIELLLNLGF